MNIKDVDIIVDNIFKGIANEQDTEDDMSKDEYIKYVCTDAFDGVVELIESRIRDRLNIT